MNKNKKLAIILISTIGGTILTYFLIGIIAITAIYNNIFNHRGSDISDLDNDIYYSLFYNRDDYSNLANRTIYQFESDGNTLTGYFYKQESPKGTIMCVHGYSSMADADHAMYQSYLFDKGYNIFSFDLTSHGRSEGESVIGLHHSYIDVTNAYNFLLNKDLIANNILYLVGHSMGAYGISASLSNGVKADKIITFSGFDSPRDELFYGAESLIGHIAYITMPAFDLGLMMNEKDAYLSASKSILETKTQALIIQGDKDEAVIYDKSSIYCKVEEDDYIEKLLIKGATHSGVWRSLESSSYYEEIMKEYNEKYADKTLNREEKEEFLKDIDFAKLNSFNQEVIEKIDEFLKK